jgi:hypothetical protein
MGADRSHILRALEGAWVGTVFVTQAAFQLLHRLIFVVAHPVHHLVFDDADSFAIGQGNSAAPAQPSTGLIGGGLTT